MSLTGGNAMQKLYRFELAPDLRVIARHAPARARKEGYPEGQWLVAAERYRDGRWRTSDKVHLFPKRRQAIAAAASLAGRITAQQYMNWAGQEGEA
jgi:hypothetical protein